MSWEIEIGTEEMTVKAGNSAYAILVGFISLVVVGGLAALSPPLGIRLLFCLPILIFFLAHQAISWSKKEWGSRAPGIASAAALIFAYVLVVRFFTPATPTSISVSDLAAIEMGSSYADVASVIGSGKWISDADEFTVSYDLDDGSRLELVFADGQYLADLMLFNGDDPLDRAGTLATRDF